MRIVVVDDEPLIVHGLVEMIKNMPGEKPEVFGTSSPEQALSHVIEYRPELLITDIRMVGLSGVELMQSVRRSVRDINIVVISGYDDYEFVRAALRINARDYLLKPVDTRALYEVIAGVMEEYKEQDDGVLPPLKAKPLPAGIGQYSEAVQHLILYIENNCGQGVSLSSLSEYSGLNANYICTLFKKEVGMNFLEFMNEVRLRRAQQYLAQSEMTMAEVAQKVGYQTERQFFRMFKKKTGVTPSKYRQSIYLRENR